jgi:tyrosine-specific transport protein
MVRKSLLAISTLIGTIIGAGIFGIPYVVSKSSFPVGVIHILIISILILITMLYLGEISLRTKGNHHLTGYAQKYLGFKGKILMLAALGFGIYSAIIAYLIGVSNSLSYLFFNSTDQSLLLGIAFWIFMAAVSYKGIKALQDGEFFGVTIILLLIIGMSVFFANKIDISNLTAIPSTNLLTLLAPFGVILFAFLGYATIPEVERILKGHEKRMKSSIILAILISAVAYILFAAVVIGFNGTATPEIATIGLGKPFIFLGILTMFTSYLAVSIALIDMFHFDFSLSRPKAWLLTTLIPLAFFILLQLFNAAHFTTVLGIGGVISGGLTAILILFMINNAKIKGDRKPEYSLPTSRLLTWILIIVFTLGTIAEIINTLS